MRISSSLNVSILHILCTICAVRRKRTRARARAHAKPSYWLVCGVQFAFTRKMKSHYSFIPHWRAGEKARAHAIRSHHITWWNNNNICIWYCASCQHSNMIHRRRPERRINSNSWAKRVSTLQPDECQSLMRSPFNLEQKCCVRDRGKKAGKAHIYYYIAYDLRHVHLRAEGKRAKKD